MRDRITAILERWFLDEPPLFQVVCVHELKPNLSIACPVRCGRRRIEYNPLFLVQMTDRGLEEALRTEAVRILLKHPYERRPECCSQEAMAIGSNLVVGDNYSYTALNIEKPADFGLPGGKAYEWYSREVQRLLQQDGGGGDGDGEPSQEKSDADERRNARSRDLAELWEDDELMVSLVNGIIEGVKEWGSLEGKMAEYLKASTRARIDWRKVMSGFRASILSSKRKLTRMRPNRRTGFLNMGSIRRFDTRLLVAVDVSGSISSESLRYFYGVVNSAFRYGFEAVDVIQFDCGVRAVQSLKKVVRETIAVGRGGTSFQEPIDYAVENGYDGLVILTDGYAPQPDIPDHMHCKIIWVCENRDCYEQHHKWMEQSGRVCTMELT